MSDEFSSFTESLTSPLTSAFEITPNDSNDLSHVTRGLYVGGSGNVSVILKDGSAVTLSNLTAGVVHPFRVRRVLSTGTTATGIVGGY